MGSVKRSAVLSGVPALPHILVGFLRRITNITRRMEIILSKTQFSERISITNDGTLTEPNMLNSPRSRGSKKRFHGRQENRSSGLRQAFHLDRVLHWSGDRATASSGTASECPSHIKIMCDDQEPTADGGDPMQQTVPKPGETDSGNKRLGPIGRLLCDIRSRLSDLLGLTSRAECTIVSATVRFRRSTRHGMSSTGSRTAAISREYKGRAKNQRQASRRKTQHSAVFMLFVGGPNRRCHQRDAHESGGLMEPWTGHPSCQAQIRQNSQQNRCRGAMNCTKH